MKRLLTDGTVDILRTRVYISRSTHLFNLRELAKGFGIEVSTLHRYDNLAYRAASLAYARERTKRLGGHVQTCWFCKSKLETHQRCPACTILLHNEDSTTCGASYCVLALLGTAADN